MYTYLPCTRKYHTCILHPQNPTCHWYVSSICHGSTVISSKPHTYSFVSSGDKYIPACATAWVIRMQRQPALSSVFSTASNSSSKISAILYLTSLLRIVSIGWTYPVQPSGICTGIICRSFIVFRTFLDFWLLKISNNTAKHPGCGSSNVTELVATGLVITDIC